MSYTAEQVKAEISGLNRTPIAPVPEAMRNENPVNIFNVSDRSWSISQGSFGTFFIPACEEGQPYSRPCVLKAVMTEVVHEDIGRSRYQVWDGRAIAHDVIGAKTALNDGAYQADSDLTKFGVFVAAGDKPTAAELAAANAAYEKKLVELVQDGDAFWYEGPNSYNNIQKEHRDAATRLKVDRPWNKAITQQISCPGCGESVNPAAAVHAGQFGCGAVINEDRVIAIKLKGYEHLWQHLVPAAEPKSEAEPVLRCGFKKEDGTECQSPKMKTHDHCYQHTRLLEKHKQ